MAVLHLAQVRAEHLILYARNHRVELADDPALAAIQQGQSFDRLVERHDLVVEGAARAGRRAAEPFDLAGKHGAPARLIAAETGQTGSASWRASVCPDAQIQVVA